MPEGTPTLTAIGHDPCTTDHYIIRNYHSAIGIIGMHDGQCIVYYGSNHRLY